MKDLKDYKIVRQEVINPDGSWKFTTTPFPNRTMNEVGSTPLFSAILYYAPNVLLKHNDYYVGFKSRVAALCDDTNELSVVKDYFSSNMATVVPSKLLFELSLDEVHELVRSIPEFVIVDFDYRQPSADEYMKIKRKEKYKNTKDDFDNLMKLEVDRETIAKDLIHQERVINTRSLDYMMNWWSTLSDTKKYEICDSFTEIRWLLKNKIDIRPIVELDIDVRRFVVSVEQCRLIKERKEFIELVHGMLCEGRTPCEDVLKLVSYLVTTNEYDMDYICSRFICDDYETTKKNIATGSLSEFKDRKFDWFKMIEEA